jgi:hypothetical protein
MHTWAGLACGKGWALLIRPRGQMLVRRSQGPAQLVAAHRTEVFALQPDFGVKLLAQMIVALQRRLGEELAQGAGGGAGRIGELGHRAIKRALPEKTSLRV